MRLQLPDGFQIQPHWHPAVALTAYAREEDRRKAVRTGFQTHLAKPAAPDELAEVVASLAGRTSGE